MISLAAWDGLLKVLSTPDTKKKRFRLSEIVVVAFLQLRHRSRMRSWKSRRHCPDDGHSDSLPKVGPRSLSTNLGMIDVNGNGGPPKRPSRSGVAVIAMRQDQLTKKKHRVKHKSRKESSVKSKKAC